MFYAITVIVSMVWVVLLRLLPPAVRADPAALVDMDPAATTLRISTLLPRARVAGLVTAAGYPVEPAQDQARTTGEFR